MKVTVTPELKDFLSKYGENSYKNSNKIDVDVLFKIYSKIFAKHKMKNKDRENLNESDGTLPSLQELVLNSRKEIDCDLIRKNKENINNKSIIEILRKRSEERKYQSYIKNLSQAKYNRISNNIPDAFGVYYSRDVLMSINALIGLILTFVGGFYAPIYMGLDDLNTRIFIGIGCSVICLIAEVSLFMIYDVKRNIKVSKAKREDPVYKFLNNKNRYNIESDSKISNEKKSRQRRNKKYKQD